MGKWQALALSVGVVLGLTLSYVPIADASRNGSGTYSLPGGTTAISGQTATATQFNTFTTDVAAELTLSLDRNGRGAMNAPLQLSNGTVSLPSLTFGTDTDTGLYRIGANNPGLAAGGVKIQEWTATTTTIAKAATCSDVLTVNKGVLAYGGDGGVGTAGGEVGGRFYGKLNGNSDGVEGFGAGTGAGVLGTGGSSDGQGGYFTGGGTVGQGSRSYGASNGNGAEGYGGGAGVGVYGKGGTTGAGAQLEPGTAAVAGTARYAAELVSGHLRFTPAVNPTSTVGFSNALTPMNLVKAFAQVWITGVGTKTIRSAFNVSGVTFPDADTMRVTFATGFAASTNYFALAVPFNASGGTCNTDTTASASYVDITCFNGISDTQISLGSTSSVGVSLIAMGAQ